MKAKKYNPGKQGKESGNFSNSNGKQKESRSRSLESQEEVCIEFPLLQTVDKAGNLHCYSTVLNRNKEDAVGMEDLDRLQAELELMLSAAAIRVRTLQAEVNNINISEENRTDRTTLVINNKKRKFSEIRVAKSTKDLSKVREREGSTKMDNISSGNETDNSDLPGGESQSNELLKAVIPKDDTPNKFWASVEPYVGDITEENIKELEDLIQSCDNDMAGIKIPPLGRHYSTKWADDDLEQEKQASAGRQVKNSPTSESETVNLLKRASNLCNDRSPGPLVQRLVSALIEEPSRDSFNSKLGDENDSTLYLGKLPLYHTTACFERRIRRELEAVGFLDTENDDSDEILAEIKKCEEEMKIVSALNKEHLKRLLGEAKTEMKKQEIKRKIKVLDAELIEIYRKTTATKLKKKQLQKKEKKQAWKVLKDRELLLKSLESV